MRLCFDIETDGLIGELTQIHCLCIQDVDTGEKSSYTSRNKGSLYEGTRRLEEAEMLIGHNIINFDIPVLHDLMGFRLQDSHTLFDTQCLARVIHPDLRLTDLNAIRDGTGPVGFPRKFAGNHSLRAWGYRIDEHKAPYPGSWEVLTDEMLSYCEQDVNTNVKLFHHLWPNRPPDDAMALEQQFSALLFLTEVHGFKFNIEDAEKLCAELLKEQVALTWKLQGVFPPEIIISTTPKKGLPKTEVKPFNPNSRQQVAKALIDTHGWVPKKLTPTGRPEVNEKILEKLPYPEAADFARLFLIGKRVGQVAEGKAGWLRLVKSDGRIHARAIASGTITGRLAHYGPNLAQVPSVGKPWGSECRSLFCVPAGKKLVGCDAAGIQLRLLAHYLAPFDRGRYCTVVVEQDPHLLNQTAIGLATRDLAKTWIYAYIFGAGDGKLGSISGGSARVGRAQRAAFIRAIPAFGSLTDSINKVVESRGYLKGLDGRRYPVDSPHTALNYLLQGAEAIIMKRATVFLYEEATRRFGTEAFCMVAHVHDEYQIECRESIAEEIGTIAAQAITQAGEYYNLKCPLAGEFRVGNNWAETH